MSRRASSPRPDYHSRQSHRFGRLRVANTRSRSLAKTNNKMAAPIKSDKRDGARPRRPIWDLASISRDGKTGNARHTSPIEIHSLTHQNPDAEPAVRGWRRSSETWAVAATSSERVPVISNMIIHKSERKPSLCTDMKLSLTQQHTEGPKYVRRIVPSFRRAITDSPATRGHTLRALLSAATARFADRRHGREVTGQKRGERGDTHFPATRTTNNTSLRQR